MKVADIMTPNVEVISADATLKEAGEKMKTLDVGSLPVYDGDQLVGMVTDRDITIRATAEGADPTQTRVREAMTWDIVYVFSDQDVKEAAKLMEDRQLRRLMVVNSDRQVVGIVSLGDLAVEREKEASEVLHKVAEAPSPNS